MKGAGENPANGIQGGTLEDHSRSTRNQSFMTGSLGLSDAQPYPVPPSSMLGNIRIMTEGAGRGAAEFAI